MSEQASPGPVTMLLRRWRMGDGQAGGELAALMYQELRRLAAHFLRDERPGHTLQPTALANELYVRLFAGVATAAESREHLMALAARQMRHILIDHARHRNAGKRGNGQTALPLDAAADLTYAPDEDLLALDDALHELEQLDARAAKVVELRYFAGLTEQETANALAISVATLKRDWQFARAWLHSRLSGASPQPG